MIQGKYSKDVLIFDELSFVFSYCFLTYLTIDFILLFNLSYDNMNFEYIWDDV